MNNKQVWYVTGASKGLGLILVKQLLAAGHAVVATSRRVQDLTAAIAASESDFLPLEVDITNEKAVQVSLARTVEHFGKVDVIVNNAGYGLLGALEELSDAELRDNFDVNVFGLLHVVRHAMPYLRAQHSGHIFNISSIGGFMGGFPGWGSYCATKFAVDGLTESLAAEVLPFGVHVTTVKPGYFRTNFLSAGSLLTPGQPIAAYESVRASQAFHQQEMDQQQPGDPEKAIAVIIAVAASPAPPVHLFLGEDAYQLAEQKIAAVRQDMQSWEELALATSFA